MGFFDMAYSLGSLFNRGPVVRYGVEVTDIPDDGKKTEPQNHSTVFKCTKVLSENISRIPIEVSKNGKEFKEHKLYSKLRYRPNNYQNMQTFMSTLEYHRNTFGNAFVDLRKPDWEILPPQIFDDYKFISGKLKYHVNYSLDPEYLRANKSKLADKEEWIDSSKLLHFKCISSDGIFGLSPIAAIAVNLMIQNKASGTIISFYNNRAVAPMAIESQVEGANAARAMREGMEQFGKEYVGVQNAGKAIRLPPNTKLTPLAIQFGDAQLIETLKFTRDEIAGLYGIPSFLMNDKEVQQMDIEQQSLGFRSFTLAPIIEIYKQEFEFKLFETKELLDNINVDFDVDVLVEVDLKSKILSWGMAISKGLATPNEAAEKVGTQPVEGAYGDYKFLQAQYVPLEEYEKYNPLLKDDPNTKTVSSTGGGGKNNGNK